MPTSSGRPARRYSADRLEGGLPHRHQPLLAALAPQQQRGFGPVQVRHIQSAQFADPAAASVEDFQDGPVPQVCQVGRRPGDSSRRSTCLIVRTDGSLRPLRGAMRVVVGSTAAILRPPENGKKSAGWTGDGLGRPAPDPGADSSRKERRCWSATEAGEARPSASDHWRRRARSEANGVETGRRQAFLGAAMGHEVVLRLVPGRSALMTQPPVAAGEKLPDGHHVVLVDPPHLGQVRGARPPGSGPPIRSDAAGIAS